MDELPSYVRLEDREEDVVDAADSDEEGESDCADALLADLEKAETPSSSPSGGSRIRHAADSNPHQQREHHATAWLDGVRGISSFLVVLYHASLLAFSWDIYQGWAPELQQKGWIVRLPIVRLLVFGPPQVSLFFVVSGFSISHKALKLSHQGRFAEAGESLFSSVFRRHPRLFMPAGIVVFCSAMAAFLDPTWFGTTGLPGVAQPTRTVPQAATLLGQLRTWYDAELNFVRPINNGFEQKDGLHIVDNPFDPNLWTLPMEFSSSMAVFLVLMAGMRLRARVRIGLVFALTFYLEYNFDFPGLMLFLGGMLICDLDLEVEKARASAAAATTTTNTAAATTTTSTAAAALLAVWARVRGRSGDGVSRTCRPWYDVAGRVAGRVAGVVAFIFALWLLSTPPSNRSRDKSWSYKTIASWVAPWYNDHILVSLGAVLMILVLDQTPFLQILYTNRVSQYLGRISYSLYLIHGPLLWSVGLKLALFMVGSITGDATDVQYFLGIMLAFCLWLPIAIYLADLTTRHIDDNCVWLTKWVYEKLSARDRV